MSRDGRMPPRFGWLDALILGVSVACGTWASIVGIKIVEASLGLPDTHVQWEALMKQATYQPAREAPPVSQLVRWQRASGEFGQVMLPCLTLGVAAATFRHRECRSRRALRRVGVLTSAIAGVFVAYLFGGEFAFRWTWPLGYGSRHLPLGSNLYFQGVDVCLATSALWGVLAIGGRWKAAPEWPDRLGRVLGAAWIAYAVLGVLLRYAFVTL